MYCQALNGKSVCTDLAAKVYNLYDAGNDLIRCRNKRTYRNKISRISTCPLIDENKNKQTQDCKYLNHAVWQTLHNLERGKMIVQFLLKRFIPRCEKILCMVHVAFDITVQC